MTDEILLKQHRTSATPWDELQAQVRRNTKEIEQLKAELRGLIVGDTPESDNGPLRVSGVPYAVEPEDLNEGRRERFLRKTDGRNT